MLCHEVHGRGPTPFVGRAHLHRCHLVVSLPPSLQVDSIIEMSSHSLAARIPRHRCVPPPCFSPIEPICSRNIRWQKKKKKIIIMIRWTIRHNKCRCTHKKKKQKKITNASCTVFHLMSAMYIATPHWTDSNPVRHLSAIFFFVQATNMPHAHAPA